MPSAPNTLFARASRYRGRVSTIGLVLTPLLGACASTGATFRSGVGDTFLEHPPWYAGADVTGQSAALGHLPVAYQRGASQPALFDPAETPALSQLLADMTRFVDSLGLSLRLVEGGRVSAVAHRATTQPPDVHFGCVTETGAPDDECAEREGALGRGRQPMRLAVGRPSPEWTQWIGEVMTQQGVERVLVITLEIGQYLIRQRGLAGTKEVELGTAHVARLPWLTSLETPVSVLQLTGALVARDGRAIRIGAEGLLARRTSLPLSSIGAQALITEADIDELRTARRQDLAGTPLVWQQALRILVAQLTGEAAVVQSLR